MPRGDSPKIEVLPAVTANVSAPCACSVTLKVICPFGELTPRVVSANAGGRREKAEKHRRHQALEKLQERLQTEIHARKLGQTFEILDEGRQKGRWTGRTRGNTLLHFDDDRELTGRLVDVEVTSTNPWFLMGKAVSAPR